MKIVDILSAGRPAVSFEVFPPRRDAPFTPVKKAVRELCREKPSFMSVTYGAGGGANANTSRVASYVQNGCKTTALAHLTCVSATPEKIREEIDTLRACGVENVLALRGDKPADAMPGSEGPFLHASDLVRFLRSIDPGLCLGGACYPECHPECVHLEDDIDNLAKKVDAGVEFLTTQMFFDNNVFYRYLAKLRGRGITVPVIAGIMPVTNGKQIERICRLSGTWLPSRFKAIVDRFGDDPAAMLDAGTAYAAEQIIDLFANGVTSVHLYTMNKPEVAKRIMNSLRGIVPM